jgi:hypothetical protein
MLVQSLIVTTATITAANNPQPSVGTFTVIHDSRQVLVKVIVSNDSIDIIRLS